MTDQNESQLTAALRASGFTVHTPSREVIGDIDNAAAFFSLVVAGADAVTPAAQPVADGTPAFPPRDPTKPAEQQGIFEKFTVRRNDGSDAPGGKHHGCAYFVLDLDHDQHAAAAMRAYASSCRATHPQLADYIAQRYAAQPSHAQGDALSQQVADTESDWRTPEVIALAKRLYANYPGADAHPWVEGGNSHMQYKALYEAREKLATKPAEGGAA